MMNTLIECLPSPTISTTIMKKPTKIQPLQLNDILYNNKNVSVTDINTAIQTMEQIADILAITNKVLPKTIHDQSPSLQSQDSDNKVDNNLNTLYRLRIAAISLLNHTYKRNLENNSLQNGVSKRTKLSCNQIQKFSHNWNEAKVTHGITKLREGNCKKWRTIFQPEINSLSITNANSDYFNNNVHVDNLNATTASDNLTKSDDLPRVSSSSIQTLKEESEQTGNPTFVCYICKEDYSESHNFYPKLCKTCGKVNYEKRSRMADLQGKLALVTGGRIKIGYEIVLKLLRCGATVITTTRFPADAARRYSREEDFNAWKNRLYIYPLDLRFIRHVELFCSHVSSKYKRLDILIQNAAQTIRRPTAFYKHLIEQEVNPEKSSLFLIHSWEPLSSSFTIDSVDSVNLKQIHQSHSQNLITPFENTDNNKSHPLAINNTPHGLIKLPKSVTASQLITHPEDNLYEESPKLTEIHFPSNKFDEDHQQVDLRPNNSWMLETDQIETSELIEVNLVNSIAPFILLSKLTSILKKSIKTKTDTYSSVILVSSMEGKFNRWKSSQHPHTNCAKASLNMLARTSASYYKGLGVLVNAVDTGWITDEEPIRIRMRREDIRKTEFQPPLDSIDGAARVLDPVFQHAKNTKNLRYGIFFKNYKPSEW